MQLFAKSSRIARASRRTHRTTDLSIFRELAARYAQVTPTDPSVTLDPQALQTGQPVFDTEGSEWLVVGDPEGTTDKVVMPADQQGADVPQGVTTVEDQELASTYTLQAPGGMQPMARRADTILDLEMPNFPARSSLETPMRMDNELDGLRVGQEGFVEIMTAIQDMQDCGYDTIDVVLNIGELYPRDIGERVLAEARRKGIL